MCPADISPPSPSRPSPFLSACRRCQTFQDIKHVVQTIRFTHLLILSISLFLFFCLSLYICLAMSVLYLSVRPSVRLSLSVSSCLFLSLCFSVILSLYVCLSFSAFHKYFLSTLFVFCFYLFCTFIWLFIFGQVFSFSIFFFLCQFTFQPPYISSLYLIFSFLCKSEFHYYLSNVQPFFSVNSGSWSVALHHLSVTVNYNYNEKYPEPDAECCFVSRRMLLMKHFNSRSFPCIILINNQSFSIIRKSKWKGFCLLLDKMNLPVHEQKTKSPLCFYFNQLTFRNATNKWKLFSEYPETLLLIYI
jgi:hypothetical protein